MSSHVGFSGIVRISDVSDFIEPGQKCILPLAAAIKEPVERNLVGIHKNRDDSNTLAENKKVKVTLKDCLACSGCITTAETMLVESQTIDQMLEGIRTQKHSVITISPQSMSSLATKLDITVAQLARYFKALGASYMLDSSFARLLTRRLYYEEFCDLHLAPSTSSAIDGSGKKGAIFTGVCPGFVCYAAIMGRLVKDYLARKLQIRPSEIFHVAVMPCYDKKLEASRNDFQIHGCREVDCVVTPSELEAPLMDFIASQSWENFSQSAANDECEDKSWLTRLRNGQMIGDGDREGSGGYAEYLVRRLGADLPGSRVQREHKAKDMEVIWFSATCLSTPLKLAKLYGFRNIQNAVQKLKRHRLELDFVEIMACPSGCVNGGGQIRGAVSEQRQQICEEVTRRYSEFGPTYDAESEMEELEKDWGRLNPSYREGLFSDYHKIEKDPVNSIAIQSW